MSEAKFTRGDWKTVKSVAFDNELGEIGETTMLLIGERIFPWCHDGIQGKSCDYSEQIANANLIKTAPKIYAMLESLVNSKESDVLFEMQTEIEELLAEARGEE